MINDIEKVMAKVTGAAIDSDMKDEILLLLSRYKLEYQSYNNLCYAINNLGFRVKVEKPDGPTMYRPVTDREKMNVLYLDDEEIAKECPADSKNIDRIAMAIFRAHYTR